MSKKIYVGNMSYSTKDAKLSELFGQYGEVVSTKVVEDQFTGKSKGFAFVEMANDEDALNAINALNGKEFDNRELKVSEAFDKPMRSNGGGNGGGGRGGFRNNNSNRY